MNSRRAPRWRGRAGFWRTLRFRFAVWISLFLLAVLIAFSVFVYRSLKQNLEDALDESLQLNAVQVAGLVELENTDDLADFSLEDFQGPSMTVRLLNAQGDILSGAGRYRNLATPADGRGHDAAFSTAVDPFDDEDLVRVYTLPLVTNGTVVGFVETIQPLEPIGDTLEELLLLLQIAIPIAVLLTGVGGYWLAARALAPIDHITDTARRISADDLATRLDLPATDDEVGRLAATFNMMLSRLQDAFQRERQFTSDASHELRTPLAAIRTILETTRTRPRSTADYEQALDDVHEETRHLQALVESLLTLARHDKQETDLTDALDLADLLHSVAEAMAPQAEEKGLALTCDAAAGLHVKGNYELLARLFINLLDNAIKYTEQGAIEITARAGHDIQVTVRDTGRGIAAAHLPHVFDRFFRADASRSTPGTGLGLTIAESIATMHKGSIHLASVPERVSERVAHQGTTVTVMLPARK